MAFVLPRPVPIVTDKLHLCLFGNWLGILVHVRLVSAANTPKYSIVHNSKPALTSNATLTELQSATQPKKRGPSIKPADHRKVRHLYSTRLI